MFPAHRAGADEEGYNGSPPLTWLCRYFGTVGPWLGATFFDLQEGAAALACPRRNSVGLEAFHVKEIVA